MLESVNLVKNRRKSKFLGCFTAGDEDGAPAAKLFNGHGRRKTRKKLKLHKLLVNAVFCKASFVKKFRHKKNSWGLLQCRSNSSTRIKNHTNLSTKTQIEKTLLHDGLSCNSSSNRYSLFSSSKSSFCSSLSSSSNSSSSFSNPTAVDRRANNPGTKSACRHNPGICIVIICLAAVVLWGKACAIVVCTSACLLTAAEPARTAAIWSNVAAESREYKKRVIMEGLLQR
ncbi:uncharacterized protein LOC127266060 [Andrographis paniculata]|uniref:uncharacterized protein LOC127266060 n=1 Tax=Andrographis paniculata TaxID=175694 RepID=UPI0021E7D0A9|nr:uncharacterized protein LOC127266060 [Andrographis paniculata]